MVFESIYPGFESRRPHNVFNVLFIYLFFLFYFIFLSLLLQCKFNITVSTQIFLLYTPYVAQGPVVQSIVSLTSPLRGQLVKYFTTL